YVGRYLDSRVLTGRSGVVQTGMASRKRRDYSSNGPRKVHRLFGKRVAPDAVTRRSPFPTESFTRWDCAAIASLSWRLISRPERKHGPLRTAPLFTTTVAMAQEARRPLMAIVFTRLAAMAIF